MRLARVQNDEGIHLARINDDNAALLRIESSGPGADVVREALAAGLDLTGSGRFVALDDVKILAPVANPVNFLAIGLNYRDHAARQGWRCQPHPWSSPSHRVRLPVRATRFRSTVT